MRITLKTWTQATNVLEGLSAIIALYGFASVADAKNLTSQIVTYEDYRSGWTDLSKAHILKITNRWWFLVLPDQEDFSK